MSELASDLSKPNRAMDDVIEYSLRHRVCNHVARALQPHRWVCTSASILACSGVPTGRNATKAMRRI